jgi:hypothetical protein
MGTISVTTPSDGTTADVSDYNTPINTIVNTLNGNIDADNLKANSVPNSALAGGIMLEKIDPTAVPRVSAYASSVKNADATGTWTKIDVNTEVYDVGSCFDTTNKRWVAPYNCDIHISATIGITTAGMGADETMIGAIFKNNNGLITTGVRDGSGTSTRIPNISLSCDTRMVTGDYIELFFLTSTLVRGVSGGSQNTRLDIFVIGKN